MDNKIRIGICGYGNLGKGAHKAIQQSTDMELKVIFTRRDPKKIEEESGIKACLVEDMINFKDELDVVIMCGGSKEDLPVQVPMFAGIFNTVDSFDTHADIPSYFEKIDKKAKSGNKVSIISVRMGPRYVFTKSCIFRCYFTKWKYLHFLGKRYKSRSLRCNSQN